MKLRTVGKLGVVLSVILFCIGVGLYSFARLSSAESGKDTDLLASVPCRLYWSFRDRQY